jgi:hypothetical protein
MQQKSWSREVHIKGHLGDAAFKLVPPHPSNRPATSHPTKLHKLHVRRRFVAHDMTQAIFRALHAITRHFR